MAYELTFPRFVSPDYMKSLKGSDRTGVVTNDGEIEDDGETLIPESELDVEPGTEVNITLSHGRIYAKTESEIEKEKQEKKQKREEQQRKREQRHKQKREEANEFWEQYEIPFDFGIAYKARLSELSRGSSGTGRDSRSVLHFYVQESFTDGRLERDEGDFLCKGDAKFPYTPDETSYGQMNEEDFGDYTPKVTCKTCLKRMKRWKKENENEE